jgi:hypothetical protein
MEGAAWGNQLVVALNVPFFLVSNMTMKRLLFMGATTLALLIPVARASLTRAHTTIYSWKTNIASFVFWADKTDSDFGGKIAPQDSPIQKPFYVALPFNDLKYPDLTRRWMPANWQFRTHGIKGQWTRIRTSGGKTVFAQWGEPGSACRGRWVEIKDPAGRVCYAQWEGVGPLRNDDAPYVFGPERPTGNGLAVSPAVAKYLDLGGTSRLSWRFVDAGDVPPGRWLDAQEILLAPNQI